MSLIWGKKRAALNAGGFVGYSAPRKNKGAGMFRFGALIAVAMLGGCSSFGYFGETYGSMAPHVITTRADSWWVFDRAAEGKVIVQRTPGNAAGLGLNPAAQVPRPDYQEAAEAFLAQSGRTCKIKDGNLVVAPSWEFSYECDAAAAQKKGT